VDEVNLIGNAFAVYAEQFTLPMTMLKSAQVTVPSAASVARLAQVEFEAGRYYSAAEAQPLYLRNKVALTIAERQK